MSSYLKHIIQGIAILLVQILIIDQVSFGQLNAYINPIIIGLFFISLPIGFSTRRMLFIAFVMGGVLDVYHDTLGMNISASLSLVFFRPFFLRIIESREGFHTSFLPTVVSLGLPKFMSYAGLLFFIYHLNFFLLESFSALSFVSILLKTVLSSIVALVLSVLLQYLTYNKQ